MTFEPNSRQALYLLKLLAFDEIQLGVIPPLRNKQERDQLKEHGLIEISSIKKKLPTSKTPVKFVLLSEKGWAWIARNLGAELSKSQVGSMILSKLLSKLKLFLDQNRDIALVNLFSNVELHPVELNEAAPGSSSESAPGRSAEDNEKRIEEAYLKASGGKWNVRVRLADLRKAVSPMSREELDTALFTLEEKQRLVLYPLNDPSEIRPEDELAAIDVLGQTRHIIYMEE